MKSSLEIVLRGPPVSWRAGSRSYWKDRIREAAHIAATVGIESDADGYSIVITNYYSESAPDVDNIIKPILDALQGIIYDDDSQVLEVTSRKIPLTEDLTVEGVSPALQQALAEYDDVVHVVVNVE